MASSDLHRLGEERSIAMHRAIAQKLDRDETLLPVARARVEEWLRTGSVHPEYAMAWRRVLQGSSEDVATFLVDPSERARALRQSSPFAFALDARERWKIRRSVPWTGG